MKMGSVNSSSVRAQSDVHMCINTTEPLWVSIHYKTLTGHSFGQLCKYIEILRKNTIGIRAPREHIVCESIMRA